MLHSSPPLDNLPDLVHHRGLLSLPPKPGYIHVKNLFSVEGKTVLVTGGSRGIGLMIARGYVENGAIVYISSRKAEVCDAEAVALSKYGECHSLPADISTMDGIEKLAAAFAERENKLNILVNNAGAAWGAPIDDFPEQGWDKIMDLNVKSVFFLTQKLLPQLRAAATAEDPARVINIGSIDGLGTTLMETYSYPASKAAVHHLTRILAHRLASENINVNAIAPGPFESQMTEHMLELHSDEINAENPRGRIGSPEDIAGTAIYLSSRAGAYTTGHVIPVDGGFVNAR
ncbi:MAG: SDR family oxidoreductase [Alphaproteobacteria bacterium]|jgi:NAD(P)-dependent dehydrogenase (short-subunit alcohol dehydrogenase family)|nr:SDR family oxidoreductase [Alphaproteobacteria bacterium]MBT4082247.1 SDR family oxidoreductase [Alphaproteobacteria bacterium]MBT4542329.1 SDR family oxidoreductase [Alphaproteobacteria bacterium]MBT7746430.1 SDR family oxidoreductase [Alphaproteobacteria bacterium]